MRKGADILSKWVGESERQLRLASNLFHATCPRHFSSDFVCVITYMLHFPSLSHVFAV